MTVSTFNQQNQCERLHILHGLNTYMGEGRKEKTLARNVYLCGFVDGDFLSMSMVMATGFRRRVLNVSYTTTTLPPDVQGTEPSTASLK